MRKHLLMGAALALLTSTAAWGADNTATAPAAPAIPPSSPTLATQAPAAVDTTAPLAADGSKRHQWTLEEARKHAHEHADKLDKMTEADWAAHQQKRHEWKEKWAAMTPDEKAVYKKMHHRHEHADTPAGAAPASGGQ